MFLVPDEAAVFIGRVQNAVAASPLPFDAVVSNHGNRWDVNTNKFSSVNTAIYFVSLSVGVEPSVPIKYTLMMNTEMIASISRSSTAQLGPDTTSRDIMVHLSAEETLYIYSGYGVRGTLDRLYTSLTIISITNAMTDFPVAFSVARDATTLGFLNPVTFNVEIVNEGGHYSRLHVFTAPSNGIYYFSISVGLVAGATSNFVLYKNFQPFVNIFRLSTNHNGNDTMGRGIMTTLQRGDQVHVVNEDDQIAWSTPELETSFSGFLYEPAHENPVCLFDYETYPILLNLCDDVYSIAILDN